MFFSKKLSDVISSDKKQEPIKRESKKRTQYMKIYIKNEKGPFDITFSAGDSEFNDLKFYWLTDEKYFESLLSDYLSRISNNGIRIDNFFYPPQSIIKIEIGKSKLETIKI